MQPIIKDIILSISDDVVSNLPQSFEKTYYGKMNYSSKNTILDSDNKLLKETIGFEIAFIHVITYFLAYSIACAVAHIEKNYPNREIQVEIPEDFRMVPMDAKLIEQVITNLLDNAVKHTNCEEAITVCVSYFPDKAQVTVRDEGEGIAKEDEGNLFQIFYTSKTRAADVRKGIGLGLTICETVVNAHGGTITGRNREDGKGAEFIFTLPLERKEESQ